MVIFTFLTSTVYVGFEMCGITLQCLTVLRMVCLDIWGVCAHCNGGTWYWFLCSAKNGYVLEYLGLFVCQAL